MQYSGTITSKGQITIPVEVRKRPGLRDGDRVDFLIENGTTIIRPARRSDHPFAPYRGALADKLPGTIDEIVREERRMRGHND
ncbi:MAG TPA: AbrB/MazE/SpoVT family DNA-binding domain-containing protein [Bryobacteraceae bacterium]|nr:AbrB/MazE/SpoVT family DNA-binding domain-containing protein [Bryobacteraceae bacterium]